ncbi:MAG: FecR domain-containing protein [Cyclobacteriaceae bacterium]
MNKNKRFEELFEKYKDDSLTKSEFQEFILMLNHSNNIDMVGNLLNDYWDAVPKDQVYEDCPRVNFVDKKSSNRFAKRNIAASFLILISAVIIYFVNRSPGELYTSYKTDFSQVLEVELPDGSVVTLNANSALAWNNEWKKNGKRQVTLDGEAFFDIETLDREMIFTVETGSVSVEAVGTSFNVNNRDQKVEVYLDEGKVNLHIEHDVTNIIAMEPGQKVKYDAGLKKTEKSMNESMISSASWKKGVLNFKDMEFKEVLDKLKNIYGKSFKCEEHQLLTKTIYLGVPYSDWEAVRQAMELSLDIQITESGGITEITSN